MKLIKCIIRPNKVDDVRTALEKASIAGMTVTEVRGHGRQKGHKAIYRGREYEVNLLPKTMIEIVIPDQQVDSVLRIVMETARTGDIGDGRIFVLPVEEGHNIRTGERDD
jgi:nitrogen regulatory protein PII